MRNVAKRMMNGELAQKFITMRLKWEDDVRVRKAQERAEAIMKRVGGRWLNREASDCFREWNGKMVQEKSQQRAEAIMRRVGGRMRNKELALNWAEWYRNYKGDMKTMWLNRNARLQEELDAMNLKFMMVTQVKRCLVVK